MQSRALSSLAAGIVLCVGAMTVGVSASNADDPRPGPQPGLPYHSHPQGHWAALVQGGAAETKVAKQWARVPMQAVTAFSVNELVPLDPDDPRTRVFVSTNYAYLMAETGAPHNYGLTAPFTVRTVAFGSIPVTATLRLAQLRDANDLPIPIFMQTQDEEWPRNNFPEDQPSFRYFHDANISEKIEVQLVSLVVDGVDLGLRPGCKTGTHATLKLLGKGFYLFDPNNPVEIQDPGATGHFAAGAGGQLTGTVDVPALADCFTKTGEDVSPLLTAAISGSGNAVTLNLSRPLCSGSAPDVGAYDPYVLCPEWIPDDVPLPTGSQ